MEKEDFIYKSLIEVKNLDGLTIKTSLKHIGQLIDVSLDLEQSIGLEKAVRLTEELHKKDLNACELATSNYFLANAWANLRFLKYGENQHRDWEQEETEKEIIYLRKSLNEEAISCLPDERICQILTKSGNILDNVGRFVEAIEYWDKALNRLTSCPIAHGNRGYCLINYAQSLYDQGHKAIFLKNAYNDLKIALSSVLNEDNRKFYEDNKLCIEDTLSSEFIASEVDMLSFSLGTSKEEIQYRQWCLNNYLFLNPLNDLGPQPIAAQDILSLPSVVTGIDEGPYYPGYFNQMKQEFVSARYLYFEGINIKNSKKSHFSDKKVLLFNTFDYPSYSIYVEKVKIAFRITYSLFDKIAYFLNHYLKLSIPERRVSFKTFWYKNQDKKKGLNKVIQECQNIPLQGLFWLSKDLFEEKEGFQDSIEPDAQKLSDIRNHLEHKYLKLHDDLWLGPSSNDRDIFSGFTDILAYSIYRQKFERKTLRLLKLTRASLIYLSLAIFYEEQLRAKERGLDTFVGETMLDVWEDNWKV